MILPRAEIREAVEDGKIQFNPPLEDRQWGQASVDLVPTEDHPCQLTFFQLTSEVPEARAYGAKSEDAYQNQEHPLKLKGETTQ